MTSTTVTALEPETLRQWMAEHEDLVVVDVRSAAEFEALHIHGSCNVPLPLLAEHTAELAARLGERVVLVRRSGVRAEQARQKLAGAGIGTGLTFSAASNTCAMGRALAAMPWNRAAAEPTATAATNRIPTPAA